MYGTGATREEPLLARSIAAGATALVLLAAWSDSSVQWAAWQYAVAAVVASMTAVVSPLVTSPDGFAWLPVVIVLKLTLALAVREEPYRPVREDDGE